MMMVIIISLKVIICKSAYLKALKFISILCVCSLTPQPIPSINLSLPEYVMESGHR